MKPVLVFVLVLVAGIQGESGCHEDCGCGALDKSDPYLFIGEYLNMTCTLNEDAVDMGYNSSKLVFRFTDNMDYVDVPENETTVINKTSLTLHKKMTSFKYNGQFKCCLQSHPSNKTRVGRTYVELEYPPQIVKNFQCKFYDWDVNLTCTWELGVKYRKQHNINVSLNMDYGSCPNQQLTNCTWTNRGNVTFDRSELNFMVIVNNTLRNRQATTGWITIKRNENVKPSKVEFLNAMTLNSTCIELEWYHNKIHRTKLFIITYTSKWEKDEENFTSTKATICKLRPFTMYDFMIVTVPGFNQGYPSEPEYSHTRTEIDVPSRPEISRGSFMVDKDGCQNGRKTVTLYWKSVPEEFQNGPMKGYQISVNNSYCDQSIESSQCVVDVEPNVLEKSFEIPCDQQTTFFICSVGAAGMSINDSALSIPVDHDDQRPTQIIVEAQKNFDKTNVSLSWDWNPVLDRPVQSCTVYYCQYDTKCTNEIAWKDVYNSTHTIIEDVKFDRKYQFGVSCDGSGFKWQTCYYFKMEPSPPNTVEVRAFPDDAITVEWSHPECEKSPYITNYRVTWCEADGTTRICKDPSTKKMKIIPSTEPSSYVIQDVDVAGLYGVAVQFQDRDGNWSVESEVKLIQPTNSDLKPTAIIGLVFAGLVVFVFFIAGIKLCYRQCTSQIKDFNRPYDILNIEITTGEPISAPVSRSAPSEEDPSSLEKLIPPDTKEKEYTLQISKDSGRGSLTSDTLHSPTGDEKCLFPVEEGSLNSSDSKNKHSLKINTEIDQPLGYAKVTMLDPQTVFTNMPASNQQTCSGDKNQDSYVRQDIVDIEFEEDLDPKHPCKKMGEVLDYASLQNKKISQMKTSSPKNIKNPKTDLTVPSKLSNEDSSSTNAGYLSELFFKNNNGSQYIPDTKMMEFPRDDIVPKQGVDPNSSPYISNTKMKEFSRDDIVLKKGDESNSSPYISDTKMKEFPRDDIVLKQGVDSNSSPYISDTKIMEFPRDNIVLKQGDESNSSPYISDTKMMEFSRDDIVSMQRDDTNSSPYVSDTKMMELPRDNMILKLGNDTNSFPYISDTKMMEFSRDNLVLKQGDDTNSSPYISDTKMMEFPLSVNGGFESGDITELCNVDISLSRPILVKFTSFSQENDSPISDFTKNTSNHQEEEKINGKVDEKVVVPRNLDHEKDIKETVLLNQSDDNTADNVDSNIEDLLNQNFEKDEEEVDSYVEQKLLLKQLVDNSVEKVDSYVDQKLLLIQLVDNSVEKVDSYVDEKLLLKQLVDGSVEKVDSYVDEKLLLKQLVDNGVEKVDSYVDEKVWLNQLVDNSVEKVDSYVDEKLLLQQLVDNSVKKVDSNVSDNELLHKNNVNFENNNNYRLGEEYDSRTSETNLRTNEDSLNESGINESSHSFGYVFH